MLIIVPLIERWILLLLLLKIFQFQFVLFQRVIWVNTNNESEKLLMQTSAAFVSLVIAAVPTLYVSNATSCLVIISVIMSKPSICWDVDLLLVLCLVSLLHMPYYWNAYVKV